MSTSQRVVAAFLCVITSLCTYFIATEALIRRVGQLEHELALEKERHPSQTNTSPIPFAYQPLKARVLPAADQSAISSDSNAHAAILREDYRARFFERVVSNTAARRDAADSAMLSELGVTPEQAGTVKSNLVELHRKAIAAGEPLSDLIKARVDYDAAMQTLLGESNYLRYRAYEESKPAQRELELLREYAANSSDMHIDDSVRDELVRMIKASGATSTEMWHGPYDPLPRPAYGQQMCNQRLQENINDLIAHANVLISDAASSDLPAAYQELLVGYYRSRVQEQAGAIGFFSRPLDEIRSEIRAINRSDLGRPGTQP